MSELSRILNFSLAFNFFAARSNVEENLLEVKKRRWKVRNNCSGVVEGVRENVQSSLESFPHYSALPLKSQSVLKLS